MANNEPKNRFAPYEPMAMDYERRLAIVYEVIDRLAPNSYRIHGPDYRSGFEAFEIIPDNPKAASVFLEATTDIDCFHVEGFALSLHDGDEDSLRGLIEGVVKGNFKTEHWAGGLRRCRLKVGEKWRGMIDLSWPFFPFPFFKRTRLYEPYN